MINVGIIGISGYSGKLILKILLNHPEVRVAYIAADTTRGDIQDIHPEFKGKTNLICAPLDLKKALSLCDLFFVAVPHTQAMKIIPRLLLAKKKVIDLSADYRFSSKSEYEKYYHQSHADPENLSKAVYGLPELYREDIKKAFLVANPGCYPTASILSLAPVVATLGENIEHIIIDAKSGVSGAGRKATIELMYAEMSQNFKAYKILSHQHAPEINLYLKKLSTKTPKVKFVPHLAPLNVGIFETIYVCLKKSFKKEKIASIYYKFYKKEPFVRIFGLEKQPEIKNVSHTNYCDIGLTVLGNTIVITSAIDNLMKGASGQAVQNMNIMCGFEEKEALE